MYHHNHLVKAAELLIPATLFSKFKLMAPPAGYVDVIESSDDEDFDPEEIDTGSAMSESSEGSDSSSDGSSGSESCDQVSKEGSAREDIVDEIVAGVLPAAATEDDLVGYPWFPAPGLDKEDPLDFD